MADSHHCEQSLMKLRKRTHGFPWTRISMRMGTRFQWTCPIVPRIRTAMLGFELQDILGRTVEELRRFADGLCTP
jgi:hypothetical protein